MNSYSSFPGVTSGLTNTFSLLASLNNGNVTASNISTAMNNPAYSTTLNSGFASYLLSNFATLDKNGDGKITSAELSTLTSSINATGLTASQLSQLGTAAGLSTDSLEQVLQHFADIDTNGDGKVTSSEIKAFQLTSSMQQKKTEFSNRAAKDQSLFYGSDESISDDDSSMLSFKNWNSKSSGTSSTSGTGNT